MTAHHRVALALAVLATAAFPAPAQDPPPPGPGDASSLTALKKEMEDAYLEIQRDYEALTGPKAAETVAALEAAVAEVAKNRLPATLAAEEFPEVWTSRKLLGAVVAGRLAARLQEAMARASDVKKGEATGLGDSLRIAVKLVFPEATMADNWDHHFTDLDVVRRWAKARGAAPSVPDPPKAAGAPDPSDMVAIPKGDLLVPEQRGRGWPHLGQKAEKRSVRAFYIDRTEVTGAAYAAFLRETKDPKVRERLLPLGWKLDDKGLPSIPEGAATLPVTGVAYEGAKAFAESHGKRLPSEDEWERAARGNAGLRYPWGPDFVEGNAVVGGKPGPAPAGATAADRSPFGVADMSGNVSEICATLPDGKPVKGLPKATEQIVIRGGNFKDPADEAANDWRYVIGPTTRSEKVGFRCAMDEAAFERRFGKR
jgi:formylglycine-generating enzyme required for sulfatase activity